MPNKNKSRWNNFAGKYSQHSHSDKNMSRILENPANAFHSSVWNVINKYMPDLRGKKICVPSSGNNLAVFAFAMLDAEVVSCDIAENQLINAENIAKEHGWEESIRFVCADTMKLDEIESNVFDFVYTSNGVHVWIDDLQSMYKNICRIIKPGGTYIMYDIHPFHRPFDDNLKVIKPYDMVGPFEDTDEVTFHWRLMDIVNAILDSGLALTHTEELFAEKNYDWPFWISLKDIVNGASATLEEVDSMHNWRKNPMAALPNFICLAAKK